MKEQGVQRVDVVNLVEICRVIKKRKLLILGVTLLFLLIGIGYSVVFRSEVTYTATGIMRIGRVEDKPVENINIVSQAWGAPLRFMQVIERTRLIEPPEEKGWRSKEWLEDRYEIADEKSGQNSEDTLKFSITWSNPGDARSLVLALGEAIISDYTPRFANKLSLKEATLSQMYEEIAQMARLIEAMEINQRKLEESSAISTPEILLLQANMNDRLSLLSERRIQYDKLKLDLSIEPYTIPTQFLELPLPEIAPNPRGRVIIIGGVFLFGLLVGLIVAFLRESL